MKIPEGFAERVSEFTFPYLRTEYEYRYFTVVQRGHQGDDRWAILDSPHCYNRVTKEWEYEMRPSEREDEWIAQTRMPLVEALPLALVLCAEKKIRALDRISRIVAVRVKRAEEMLKDDFGDGPKHREEYARAVESAQEWEAQRKVLEAS